MTVPTHPCIISTIPRSGTWQTKYFFRAFNEFMRSNASPDITLLHQSATNAADTSFLQDFGVAPLLIDHFACPGFATLGIPATEWWWELVKRKGSERFQTDLVHAHTQFAPQQNSEVRICLITRNPFEVAISIAGLHETLISNLGRMSRLQYIIRNLPFNPQWPVRNKKYFSEEGVFESEIKRFIINGFMEAYMIQLLSFVWMERLFPQQVLRISYEELQANPLEKYMQLVRHFRLDKYGEEKAKECVQRSIDFTHYKKMKEYEALLGQSISAPKFLANSKRMSRYPLRTHMPDKSKKVRWQQLFSEEDFAHVVDTLAIYGLKPEDISMHFARELESARNSTIQNGYGISAHA